MSSENIGRYRDITGHGERGTYINIAIRRAPTGRCDARDQFYGFDLEPVMNFLYCILATSEGNPASFGVVH